MLVTKTYNKLQQEIIDNTSPRKLVIAGPGTGKTHVLIGAAEKFLERNPGSKIALITFTNKAANEMKERLQSAAFIGTIHKFAKAELERLAQKHEFRLNLLNDQQIAQIMLSLVQETYPKSHEYAVNKMVNNALWVFRNFKEARRFLQKKEMAISERIITLYQEYKKENDVYDMFDTPVYLNRMLKAYSELLDFDALFCDESQDLDFDQFNLITQHIWNIFAIGDPRQSIYMFRGAHSGVMDTFVEKGFVTFVLEYNYRSHSEILELARCTNLEAIKGKGGVVFKNIDEAMQTNPMILCRRVSEVNAISKYYKKVSTIHQAKGLEYDNVICISGNLDMLDVNTMLKTNETDKELVDEEEVNIMFVALTRARQGVGVFPLEYVDKWLAANHKQFSIF